MAETDGHLSFWFSRMADLMDEHADDFFGGLTIQMNGGYRQSYEPNIRILTRREPLGDAVRIANNTSYSLASGIQTGDLGIALRLADRVKAGTVWINTWYKYHPNAPLGATRCPATGANRALTFESYTQYKTIWANLLSSKPGEAK